MKKWILLLLIACSQLTSAQIIKTVIVGFDTIEIENPKDGKILKSTAYKSDTIQIYRLDDNQKSALASAKYSKNKKQNALVRQQIIELYNTLETALDNMDIKQSQNLLTTIDFKLGGDAPNLSKLRDEFNCYTSHARINKERISRKEYIEKELSK